MKLSRREFSEIIKDRLNDIYEKKKEYGKEPIQAFRETPQGLLDEVKTITDEYWEWDSDWK